MCDHKTLVAQANFHRILQHEDGLALAYTLVLNVKCHECGLPFRWVGFSSKEEQEAPHVTPDAIALRCFVEPSNLPPREGTERVH